MSPLQAPPDCYSHVAAIRKACQLTCTIDTCSLSFSYWAYRPSVAANALFIALFSISLLCFLGQAIFSRRYIGFSIAMISGSALEVLGYGGRLWAYFNPFEEVSYSRLMRHKILETIAYSLPECLPASDHLPDYCTRFLRRRYLLLSVPHRPDLW